MLIKVQNWKGETFTLNANPTDYVDDLKDSIAEEHGVPTEQQRLTVNGEEIDEVLTLEELKLGPESVLVLDKIQILVALPGSKKCARLNLYPDSTIKKVKRSLTKKTKLAIERQCILLDGKEVKNNKKLFECGIEHGHLLSLEKFSVTVAHWNGDIIEITDIDPSDSVESLKDFIAKNNGIPSDQQTLLFDGKKLNEFLGLEDLKIAHKSLLELEKPRDLKKKEKFTLSVFPQSTEAKKNDCNREIDILIKDWKDEKFNIRMLECDYVEELKEKIEEARGVPVDYQLLHLDGEEVDETLPINELNLQSESVLTLEPMKVNIQLPSKKVFVLKVAYDESVKRIKRAVLKKSGIEIDSQLIFFNSEELQTKQKLCDCGIHDGYTVTVEKFKVCISHWDGDTTENVVISPNDTVDDLKQVLQTMKQIPVKDQKYSFEDKLLNEFLSLKNQGVGHQAVLHLNKPKAVKVAREKFKLEIFSTEAVVPENSTTPLSNQGKMTLQLQVDAKTTTSVEIDGSQFVEELKEKIFAQLKIPVGQQQLALDGKVLEDDESLEEQNVSDGSTLTLEPFKLSFALPNGKSIRFAVSANDTIKKLKRVVAKKASVQAAMQCFSFAGQELKDTQKVGECALEHGDTIFVEKFTISVAHWLGEVYTITDIKPADTIEDILPFVEQETGVPIDQQVFRFDGKPVNKFLALQDQQIKHKSILVLEDAEIVQDLDSPTADETGKEAKYVDTSEEDSLVGDSDDDSVASWVGRYALDEDFTSELTKIDTSNPDSWLSKVAAGTSAR